MSLQTVLKDSMTSKGSACGNLSTHGKQQLTEQLKTNENPQKFRNIITNNSFQAAEMIYLLWTLQFQGELCW